MNFGPNHYVPILKCKRGEKTAVASLAASVRAKLTPLFEIVEIKEGKSLDAHITTALTKIDLAVPPGSLFFLDAREVCSESPTASQEVFDRALAEGLTFVPVTGLSRDDADQSAAKAHSANGICLRLTKEELAEGSLSTDVPAFLTKHALAPSDVDLIMDMGAVDTMIEAAVTAIADDFLASVPTPSEWRTFTLSGCAFPASMGVVPANDSLVVPRTEWAVWSALYTNRAALQRLPTFSDCGIQHPTGVEGFDPRIHQASASVRYARKRGWLLIKGSSTKKTSATTQFPKLAAQFAPGGTMAGKFYGKSHCYGCNSVIRCADGAPSLGSPEAWRRIGTAHHLTLAAEQIGLLTWP